MKKNLTELVFILDKSGELHLRISMQGEITTNEFMTCLYNATSEAMKDFLESCVPAEETMH